MSSTIQEKTFNIKTKMKTNKKQQCHSGLLFPSQPASHPAENPTNSTKKPNQNKNKKLFLLYHHPGPPGPYDYHLTPVLL